MKTLKNWTLHQRLDHHVELIVDGQHTLCLYVLEENMFRVLLKRHGQLARESGHPFGEFVPGVERHEKNFRTNRARW